MPQTAEQSFTVRFTQAQRKAIAEMSPDLAHRLKLTEKNSRSIHLTLGELSMIQKAAQFAIGKTNDGMKRNSLQHIVDTATKAIAQGQGIGAIPVAERLYQFRITLKGIRPPIWRRIQTKDCTLDRLHEHIQTAMGWTNSHLHDFDIRGKRYGDPHLLDDGFEDFQCEDSTTTKISQILPSDGEQFLFDYEYDFGDGWQHEVLFEGLLRAQAGSRFPICLEGERACPPEDVGGIWGYEEYLTALADSTHERHEEFMEWSGPFDPEEFDPVRATKSMRQGLPNWRW